MFAPNSRYYSAPNATYTAPDGRTIIYKRRRFIPQPQTFSTLTTISVKDGDRPDTVAARTLGSSLAFWRIADANAVMHPDELTDHPGSSLNIPLPQVPNNLP